MRSHKGHTYYNHKVVYKHKKKRVPVPVVPFSRLKLALGMNASSHKDINSEWKRLLSMAQVYGDPMRQRVFVSILKDVVEELVSEEKTASLKELVMIAMEQVLPKNHEFLVCSILDI